MYLTYYNNVPNAPDDPADDQPDMQTNTLSISTLIAVDHIGFQNVQGGWHTVIHQTLQNGDPATIQGINQLYAKNYTPDSTVTSTSTQLFMRSGPAAMAVVGQISQITGFFNQNTNSSDGWQWIGGTLIQWGKVTQTFPTGTTTGMVTFKDRVPGAIPFMNNCFAVFTTLQFSAASLPGDTATVSIRPSTLSKLMFNWDVRARDNSYIGFYWVAIGN